ncbi:MAG TPA: hypothetical protein VJT71_12045 [Pyrinomonadaceae bacterium]|nr:hypothetical protein [Pyrinomonadaceae bacterium]
MNYALTIAKVLLVSLSDVLKQLRTPTVPEPYLLEYENTIAIVSIMTGDDLSRFKIPREAIKQHLLGSPFGVTRICYDPLERFCDMNYLLEKIESVVAYIDESDSLIEAELSNYDRTN